MHPWLNLIVFIVETLIIVVAILIILIGFFSLIAKNKLKPAPKINIKKLNQHYDELAKTLQEEVLSKKEFKQQRKINKKKEKPKKRLFVLEFDGDMKASGAEQLREEITMLLTTATKDDEVLVKVTSPGGEVTSYGLAASQLQRIRDHKIPLTIAVDRVAASGGYMMACVANQIIAAPFAVVGSIGVVSNVPNVHRWLKKHDIDIEQLTAGKYKRTLTLTGENTPEGREKAQEILDDIHELFIDFVKTHRPQVDIETIKTGEFWFGQRALALKLIDKIMTSDDYLMKQREESNIYLLKTAKKKSKLEKLVGTAKAEFDSIASIL